MLRPTFFFGFYEENKQKTKKKWFCENKLMKTKSRGISFEKWKCSLRRQCDAHLVQFNKFPTSVIIHPHRDTERSGWMPSSNSETKRKREKTHTHTHTVGWTFRRQCDLVVLGNYYYYFNWMTISYQIFVVVVFGLEISIAPNRGWSIERRLQSKHFFEPRRMRK